MSQLYGIPSQTFEFTTKKNISTFNVQIFSKKKKPFCVIAVFKRSGMIILELTYFDFLESFFSGIFLIFYDILSTIFNEGLSC